MPLLLTIGNYPLAHHEQVPVTFTHIVSYNYSLEQGLQGVIANHTPAATFAGTFKRTVTVSAGHTPIRGEVYRYSYSVSAGHTVSTEFVPGRYGQAAVTHPLTLSHITQYHIETGVTATHAEPTFWFDCFVGMYRVRAGHSVNADRTLTLHLTVPVTAVHTPAVTPYQTLHRSAAVGHTWLLDAHPKHPAFEYAVGQEMAVTLTTWTPADTSDEIILDDISLYYVDGEVPQEEYLIKCDEDDLADGLTRAWPGSELAFATSIHGWAPSKNTIQRIQELGNRLVTLQFRGHPVYNCCVTKFKKRRIADDLWEYWLEIKEDNSR